MLQVELNSALEQRVNELATEAGQTPGDFVAGAVRQVVEDREDYEAAVEISRRIASGEEKTSPLEEVERRLGLDS